VERTANRLLRMLPLPDRPSAADVLDARLIGRLLLSAFPDRICKRRGGPDQGFVHVQGRGVQISRDSPLRDSPFIVAVQVDLGERSEGYVHLAAPVTEDLLRSECGDRIVQVRRVAWDPKEGRVAAAMEERIGVLLLSVRPFAPGDSEVAPILCEAVRTSPGLLRFDVEARQYQARVGLLRSAFPEERWPDLSEGPLLARPEEWLLPWLGGVRSAGDLGRIDIRQALESRLTWEQQRLLDARAPVTIPVPSGSRIGLDYTSGDVPVLAVKLQEMFGLADTPRIAEGRVTVLLHLLSPARRPVQVTQDLRNFSDRIYPEVKKDLKGRYPKHPWPDDPWNAVPTKKTKPRGK
jgi:ATP-dependent helicase HrpB